MALPSTTPSGSVARRTREQPRGDRVLDQRDRREACAEHFDREREVEQRRAAATASSGGPCPGAPAATSCSQSVGAKPERLVRADGFGLVLKRSAIDAKRSTSAVCSSLGSRSTMSLYNIPECSTDVPGSARGRALGRRDARRGRARARRRRALTYAELHAQGRGVGGGVRSARRARRRPRRDAAAEHLRFAPRAARPRLAARGRGAAQHRVRRAHARLHRSTTPTPRRWSPPRSTSSASTDDPGRRAAAGAGRGRRRRRLRRREPRRREDAAWPGPEYRDIHSLMFTSGTTGPSKAVITPWAVMYQFWSWVPDDALAPGEGLYCTMPLFHNSGRSAFNYAMVCGARFVVARPLQRDRASGTTCAPPTAAPPRSSGR